MDVLADVLATTGVGGVLLAQLHSRGSGWGCGLEQSGTAGFHVVAEGTCWLRTGDQPPRQLVPGDVVLLPRGEPHQLLGSPNDIAVPYAELEAAYPPGRSGVVDLGGEGPTVRIVCGKFEYRGDPRTHPILSALPAVVHLPAMGADTELRSVVQLLVAETRGSRPGARTIAARLTDVLFVQVIRAWIASSTQEDHAPSWLLALGDDRIGAALSLMHDEPRNPWTVDQLARAVAMSRPAFARRFKELAGVPPLAYLSTLRLDLAAAMLRDSDRPISEIAESVGYTSEFAFSRAFSRAHGLAPGRYRRTSAARVRPEHALAR
ncbi:cupin domain-containing protein [Nocardia asteroides]|uniref:AraC family transcriptional regulator n=1 Tax=Nocardia asteroides TaxID=1824 RepID=UPI0037CC268E